MDPTSYIPMAIGAFGALVIFVIGWILGGIVQSMVTRAVKARGLDPALGSFLGSLARWVVIGAAVVTALGTLGIETTGLAAALASAGVAIGLALQGSLSNFAAGVMILIFRPFTIGDKIDAGGSNGVVAEIGMFATTLITADNRKVIIANSGVIGGNIINETTLGTRRADVPVGVAYGEDVEKIMGLLKAAAESCPTVLADPGVAVAFTGMGESSIDFAVMPWCESADYLTALHEVRTACYAALNKEGIDIPYPQVVMHNAS